MSVHGVVRQYANALFDVAAKHGRVAEVGRDMASLAALVAEHADLRAVFETPMVLPRKKRALVTALCHAGGGVEGEVERLLLLLADRDRLMLLGDVAAAYVSRAMDADKAVEAAVTTAEPLAEDKRAALAQALSRSTGRNVSVRASVDPGLVGGMVARVGSLVFDASILRQLERMREQLLREA